MADIINLRRFKKQTARDDARKAADANSAKFGRTKADRDVFEARTAKAAKDLDGHRLEKPPTVPDTPDEGGA